MITSFVDDVGQWDRLTNKIYRQLVILPLTSNVVDGKKSSKPFLFTVTSFAEFLKGKNSVGLLNLITLQ